MNSAVIGAFLSGLVVGGLLFAFLISKWVTLLMRKRWARLLDESPQYHEGMWAAYNDCLDFLESGPDEMIKKLKIRLLAERLRITNLLEYKDERANALGQQDALQELEGE